MESVISLYNLEIPRTSSKKCRVERGEKMITLLYFLLKVKNIFVVMMGQGLNWPDDYSCGFTALTKYI